MGYTDYLKNSLRPLRLYALDAGYGAAELAAEGEALDALSAALDDAEREASPLTATGEGLTALEALLPYRPAASTLADRRQALGALLRVDDCSFTPEALNATLSGCGIAAAAEETGTPRQVRVRFPGVRGTPPSFAALQLRIEALLPCHLGVEYALVFPAWSELERWFPTWSAFETAKLSWAGLEAYGG